jgi:hypothetical protein
MYFQSYENIFTNIILFPSFQIGSVNPIKNIIRLKCATAFPTMSNNA